MEILYRVHTGLYVNLTNRCSSACTFCLRQSMDHVGDSHNLWLERDPTAQEVKAEFEKWDLSEFTEIVFCGFGEPTCALPVLLDVASWLKTRTNLPIRVNTNGQGSLHCRPRYLRRPGIVCRRCIHFSEQPGSGTISTACTQQIW